MPIVPTMIKADILNRINSIWLVCLSPDILNRTNDEAIYTIVHELSHVYFEHSKHLGAADREGLKEREIVTDNQVITWGFEKELLNTPFNYIYGEGIVS